MLAAAQVLGRGRRQWLDHMADLGGAAKAHKVGRIARSALGAGRCAASRPPTTTTSSARASRCWRDQRHLAVDCEQLG